MKRSSEAFDIGRFAQWATIILDRAGEHLVLSDGQRHLRLDLLAGTLLSGPVGLELRLDGIDTLAPQAGSLSALAHLHRTGTFPRASDRHNRALDRMIFALRAYDGLLAGASLRQIAAGLFGDEVEWPGPGDSTRSRVRRLVALARYHAAGGYLRLLPNMAIGSRRSTMGR